MIDTSSEEVYVVFDWEDAIAFVDSKELAERLCIGLEKSSFKRFTETNEKGH